MVSEFDPHTPEDFDGDIASASKPNRASFDDRVEHPIPRVGDLSDLSGHDVRLVDDYLNALR